MHTVQLQILKELLFTPIARFRDLNNSGLTNDHFTFHLKQLIQDGLVEKAEDKYRLTIKGIEFAGRMDSEVVEIVRQPKLGVAVYVESEAKILLGQRKKDPNKGELAILTRKVVMGESLLETARKCLESETGLHAEFEQKGVMRVVKRKEGEITVDVLFVCFKAIKISGTLLLETPESINQWYTPEEIESNSNLIDGLVEDIKLYREEGRFFVERI